MTIVAGDRVIYDKKIFTVESVWFDGQEMRAMLVNRRGQMFAVRLENIKKAESK